MTMQTVMHIYANNYIIHFNNTSISNRHLNLFQTTFSPVLILISDITFELSFLRWGILQFFFWLTVIVSKIWSVIFLKMLLVELQYSVMSFNHQLCNVRTKIKTVEFFLAFILNEISTWTERVCVCSCVCVCAKIRVHSELFPGYKEDTLKGTLTFPGHQGFH